MGKHFELTDQEFEKSFSSCEMPVALFSHEAHLRLAWIHIRAYGLPTAEANITTQLKKYTQHVGAEQKFNLTLTLAAIRAVYHFYMRSKADTFLDFILENPSLKDDFKGLMSRHYSWDIFDSELARSTYQAPDLLLFDEVNYDEG